MKYGFNCGMWGNIFGIPCIVADRFLKIADGSQLKVILYLFRNNGRLFEIPEIARSLGLSEDETNDCLMFWEQNGILSSEDNLPALNNIFSVPTISESVPESRSESSAISSSGFNINPEQISVMLKSTPALRNLFNIAEKYIDIRNFAIQRSLVWIYQYLGLPPDVIITLISYCSDVNKIYVWEIDSIAYNWRKNGIDTLKLAQNEVNRLKDDSENRAFITKIKRLFDMKRNPTPKHKAIILNWKSQKYPYELIEFAYYIALEKTGYPERLPIEYIDVILKNWDSKNIKTPEQAEQDDIDFKKLFKSKKQKPMLEFDKAADEHFEEDYEIFINNY